MNVKRVIDYLTQNQGPLYILYEDRVDAFLSAVTLAKMCSIRSLPCICRELDDGEDSSGIYITEHVTGELDSGSIYLCLSARTTDEELVVVAEKGLPTLAYQVASAFLGEGHSLIAYPLISSYISDTGIAGHSEDSSVKSIQEKGIDNMDIVVDQQFIFPSQMVLTLGEILEYSVEPPVIPLLGNREEIDKLMYKLGIEPSSRIDELDSSTRKGINSQLAIISASDNKKYGMPAQYMANVPMLSREESSVKYLPSFASLVTEFYRSDHRSALFSVLLGERGHTLHRLLEQYRENVVRPLREYSSIGGIPDVSSLCHTEIDGLIPPVASRLLVILKVKGKISPTALGVVSSTDEEGERFVTFIEGENSVVSMNLITESILREKGLIPLYGIWGTVTVYTDTVDNLLSSIREFVELNFS